MIKTIYNLEPKCHVNFETGACFAWIWHEGKSYMGEAHISPEDIDFYSEKVGLHIAHSRALILLLKDLKNQTKQIYDIKYQMYQEAINYGARSPAEVDPTGAFLRKVALAEKKYRKLQKAVKEEEKALNRYLQSQDRMVRTIKTNREKDKKK